MNMNLEEFNCIFCKESFNSKQDLQIHFRKHGDPKFNQSVKSNRSRLPNEPQSGVEKSNEDGEVVSCDVCSEVFPTISKAITHKHKVHPDHDAKYFCPWCGKLFTMKHLYNKHIQTIHDSKEECEETGFHCDYCEVDFFLPSAMVYHNKFFHRQDTELAAIGHSKKMKHFHQDLLPVYYCPFCGEEYYNKVNLHKHMGDDHSDENQSPDDILRCPLCEAIFYHLDAYELHLTFHSSEDLYNEENEMTKDVTEFSLETVPPTMEKVENESQYDNDNKTTSIGFEELLQQVMNESNDNSNNESLSEKKLKKRKKHKKSKKSAITLDEFLNMNKDVFGEGIDFQGIEEVPTQVVAKQLKKKLPPKLKTSAKMPLSEIAKLKKQGIIVKKSKNNVTGATCKNVMGKVAGKSVNVVKHVLPNKITPSTQPKEEAKVSSNEVLSKLLNQNNSQLKIVKKSSQDIPDTNISLIDDTAENFECDSTQNDNMPSDTETDKMEKMEEADMEVTTKKIKSTCNEEDESTNNFDDIADDDMNLSDLKGKLSNIDEVNTLSKVEIDDPNDSADAVSEKSKCSNISNISKSQNIKMNESNAFSALRNISQHITVKPMSSPKSVSKQINPNIEKECSDNPVSSSTADEVIQEQKMVDHIPEKKENNSNKSSLNALKHLSGLITVKSINKTRKLPIPVISSKRTIVKTDSEEDSQNEDTDDESKKEPITVMEMEKPEVQKQSAKSLDALQNLSKHITIKSLNQKQNTDTEPSFESDEYDHEDDSPNDNVSKLINKTVSGNKGHIKTVSNHSPVVKTDNNIKNPDAYNKSPKHSPIVGKKSSIEKQNQDRQCNLEEENPMKKQLSNILKQLPNVTAKPLNVTKSINQQISTKSFAQSINSAKTNIIQKSFTKKQVEEEIEIFNIDDSDDEEVSNKSTTQSQIEVKSIAGSSKVDTESDRRTDVLRNLSKHITVKSTSTQKQPAIDNIRTTRETSDDDEAHDMNSDFSGDEANDFMNKSLKLIEQQKADLQNTLNNLSKHISVKSTNSLPKLAAKLDRPINPKSNIHENDDDDSNSGSFSRVKITELKEDDISEEEITDQNNTDNNQFVKKTMVQSTFYSNSEDEDHDNYDDNDLEDKIIGNTITLKKPPIDSKNSNKPVTLQNIPKGITVKSSKDKKVDEMETSTQKENPVISNLGSEMSIKPLRPVKSVQQEIIEPSSTSSSRQNPANQSSTNQKFSSSSGQVNKEVTVKTFQTETVIQEITTTVTKTIRTVKQEVRHANTTQNISMPVVRPQTIRGIRPNLQVKNFQGLQVRQAPPTAGPRIRSPIIRGRATGTVIRPSNQLVPFRPGVNVAVRSSTPRMPTIKKATPSTSNTQKPVAGKPLKISPNAMMPSMKRMSEDSTGHFSCFKKPKESLIPVSEVVGFSRGGESSMQFASSSSSQSRSNFSCMTKTVKGNSVVTSTQMKAEVSSSSEQLSRLSNMSGLKIVKTSQANQAIVKEKSEISSSKRTTLEAIEKLQKQGLLVKKPRFDEDQENSNSDGDDGNFSDT